MNGLFCSQKIEREDLRMIEKKEKEIRIINGLSYGKVFSNSKQLKI